MSNIVFADNVDQIHFAGGMVRFDLCTLVPNPNGGEPGSEITAKVIMSPQAFLGMNESMKQLIEKMIESGILIKNNTTVDENVGAISEKIPDPAGGPEEDNKECTDSCCSGGCCKLN